MTTKKPLYQDVAAIKAAMKYADQMEGNAQTIVDAYLAQPMLKHKPLTTEALQKLISGGSSELETLVAESWKESMNKFQPGLGDAAPTLPRPTNYNPARHDRLCQSLRGDSPVLAHTNDYVHTSMLTVVDGKPVIDQAARDAIQDRLTVFATPENQNQIDILEALAKAATDARKLFTDRHAALEEQWNRPAPFHLNLLDNDKGTNSAVYWCKTDKKYKINSEKLNFGKPSSKPKKKPPPITYKPDVEPRITVDPEVYERRKVPAGSLQPTRYKSSPQV